ncbi:MAG: branched-chain amino acid ABC transporter permease [Sneathiellaceae bacterium]
MAAIGGLGRRDLAALAILGLVLLAAPFLVDGYILSVLLIILYFAYVGQSWNICMGFAGQLSLGHALYVGLGAYAAAALFVHFRVPPLFGVLAAIAIGGLAAGIIGALAFRFRIGGVYFALLTIAFAEFTRILFAHIDWLGATQGLFLPVENRADSDLWTLRGAPVMFYYVFLALMAGSLLLAAVLRRSRIGYYLLAVREDEVAAQTLGVNLFWSKMFAVVLSGAMAAVGGVVLAFYYNNLFPSDLFGIHRSIEIILAPIVGGLGTVIGPLVGAVVLGVLGEGLTVLLEATGWSPVGVKQLVYALVLILIIKYLPGGIWPMLAGALGLARGPGR